ncbi:UxaA family hydrolase [Anaerolineales bacterium HSG24]|nr:UxaA family hydrolase [Anaerolineales bacterium HSG24]
MAHGALMHESDDDVAVVIQDVTTGDSVKVVTLDGKEFGEVKAAENIPLGHKIALRGMDEGKKLIKYNRVIGLTTKKIVLGAHVHTQNVRSIRWEYSVNE